MKLDDLELPKVKISEPTPINNEDLPSENVLSVDDAQPTVKLSKTAKALIAVALIFSFLLGLLGGGIGGFMVARDIYNKDVKPDSDSVFSQYDYSKFMINEKKGITIADLYYDDEERYNAMLLIGQRVPELQYVDSNEQTIELRNLGQSRYVLEFVQPTCNWCKGMVDMLDEYRATENAVTVVGLSIVDGDMSVFNKQSENTFRLKRKDETTNQFADTIPWVPTFLYIENGTIRFVSFGNIESLEKFQEYIDLAFN